jgi:hypothetical protein
VKVFLDGLFGMKCECCGSFLKEGESYDLHGKILCEDCYMYETNPPKACDPWLFRLHCLFGNSWGSRVLLGLTELQKRIYSEN